MASSADNSTTSALRRSNEYQLFKRYASITFVVAAPILIVLPPRKLDLYTIALGSAFLFSANHLVAEQTGRSVMERFGSRMDTETPRILKDLPTERAEEVRDQMRKAREAAREQEQQRLPYAQQSGDQENAGIAELGKKVWMGNETEGWKERRKEEERKALEEGKGYGSLIMDHIRDAIGVNKGDGNIGDKGKKS